MQSIEYARIIQESMLSRSRQNIEQTLNDWCLYWHPRDCVGGDIYAFQRCENGWLLVLADCTGHGVPGAFMTFIFSSALEKALTQAQAHEPDRLLASINHYIKQTLSQSHPTADMGQSNARMHAFMLGADDEEVVNLDGDRKGIGYSDTAKDYQWRRHQRPLRRGDQLLIVTDGVTDQIGGPREIMFGKKRIQSLLLQQRALPMSSISEALLLALTSWQGKQSARDDMTWFGFRW